MNTSSKSSAAKSTQGSIEIKELLSLLQGDPRARRTVGVVLALKQLADTLSFPVNSYADLQSRIGGGPLVAGGLRIDVKRMRHLVPKYYFPIASREDLLEKGLELYHRWDPNVAASPTLPLPPPDPPPPPDPFLAPARAVTFFRTKSSGLKRAAQPGPPSQ